MKKRNVHLHLHTLDGGWDESKHPRKDDGKFGTGSGGSKAEEADPVKAGGPVSKETVAANKEPAQKKQGASRAELKTQAKAALAAANKGNGSYHKAALLYEQAGETDKAAEAHALAKRYMHDPAGVAVKREADRAAERKMREEARAAGGAEGRVLSELADAYQARAEGDPEDNALTKRISDLKDEAMSYRKGKGK